MKQSRRVVNNTAILAISRTWRLGSSFLLAPYVLGHLGAEQYGLFAILGGVTAYFGLFDFGLGTAFVRHMAEYVVKGERNHIRQVLTFGMLFYLVLGVVLAPLAYFAFPLLVGLLTLSPELKGTALDLLAGLFVYFFLSQSMSVFFQLQSSMQRMWISALIGSLGQLVYIGAVVLFLNRGLGVYGVLAATFVQLAFTSVTSYVAAVASFGSLFTNPFKIEMDIVRKLLRFGGWMQMSSFAILVNSETDRFLIGSFVNVASVTPYELANKIGFLTKVFPAFGFEALLPALTSVAGGGDEAKLDRAFVQASRIMALLTVVVGGYTVAAGSSLLRVWVGQGYPEATSILVLLVFGFMVSNLTGVASTALRATGQPRYEAYYSVLGVIMNIAATLALAPSFHLFGIVVGTVIGTVVGSAYFMWLFYRIRGLSLWSDLGDWLWRLAAAGVLSVAALSALIHVLPDEMFANRIFGLASLGLLGLGYVALLALLLRLTGFFQPSDLGRLREMLPSWCTRVLAWRPA